MSTEQGVVTELTAAEAFAQLGVSRAVITDEQRRRLDKDGFVVLENVLTDWQIQYMRRCLDELTEPDLRPETASEEVLRKRISQRLDLHQTGLASFQALREQLLVDGSLERFEETVSKYKQAIEALEAALAAGDVESLRKAIRHGNVRDEGEGFVEQELFESDVVFDMVLKAPQVLAAVTHVLGQEIHLSGMQCRSPQAGYKGLSLHRHLGPKSVCNTLWMLDDVTRDNGPTRFVPGTHIVEPGPGSELDGDPTQKHPREVQVLCKAGSVVVFDDRTWHGSSPHNGGGTRRTIIGSFALRSCGMGVGATLRKKEETLARMSWGQLWMLGVDCRKS